MEQVRERSKSIVTTSDPHLVTLHGLRWPMCSDSGQVGLFHFWTRSHSGTIWQCEETSLYPKLVVSSRCIVSLDYAQCVPPGTSLSAILAGLPQQWRSFKGRESSIGNWGMERPSFCPVLSDIPRFLPSSVSGNFFIFQLELHFARGAVMPGGFVGGVRDKISTGVVGDGQASLSHWRWFLQPSCSRAAAHG